MRSRYILSIVLLSLLPFAANATTTTHLNYDAFVGHKKVARAEFQIMRAGEEFEIQGEARAVGIANALTKWRSLFVAAGRFILGQPVAEKYEVVQKKRNREKRIELRDGVVSYERDGEDRGPRPKLDGMYLLSALFLSRDCDSPGQTIHDGKDPFQLHLVGTRAFDQPTPDGVVLQCEFEVVDEDNESAHAVVKLIEREGLKVPLEMELSGAVEGKLQLNL
ncbi:MAG: DUF3108 domain-containing protein [Pseudomonadales bacterium]